jgi:glycerol-3-phosphate cytidylyltransferase
MKIGITFYYFEMFHERHVLALKKIKKKCDYLIVALRLDPSKDTSKSVLRHSITERYIQLKNSNYVDEIIPYFLETDIEDILRSYKIDVCIIANENKQNDFTGKDYCIKKGIEVHCGFNKDDFSSTEIKTPLKK